jgi:hypothetical protein
MKYSIATEPAAEGGRFGIANLAAGRTVRFTRRMLD